MFISWCFYNPSDILFYCHGNFRKKFVVLVRMKLEQVKKKLYRMDEPSPRPGSRNRENDPKVMPEDSSEKLKVIGSMIPSIYSSVSKDFIFFIIDRSR